MKIDAHYYAVLAFARACGFRKDVACQIAYASQFVDDAKINKITFKEETNGIKHDVIAGENCFFNMATCHSYFRMKTFNYDAMTNNTIAFHFIPGGKGKKFVKKLRCEEEAPIIKDILNETIENGDPIKLGLVLHPYADTFSHKGFSGMLSKVNDIKDLKNMSKIPWNWLNKAHKITKGIWKNKFDKFFDSAMPSYGHGQAIDYPDLAYLKWTYKYDSSELFSGDYKPSKDIDNKVRFSRAFKKIKCYFEVFLEKHPQFRDESFNFRSFDVLFETLTSVATDNKKLEDWVKVIIKKKLFGKNEINEFKYDESKWLRQSFSNFEKKKFNSRTVEDVKLASGFADSNWYKFYLGVNWFKNRFFHLCNKNGIKIPQ